MIPEKTVGTIAIHGSGGDVFAPIGAGSFIPGRWQLVKIVKISDDDDLPMPVRSALVGLNVWTIFSDEQANGAIPIGSRIAYVRDVAASLTLSGNGNLVEGMLKVVRDLDREGSEDLSFVVFKKEEFELVKEDQ